VLQPVWQLCQNYQCSKTQLALSYIKSYAAVSTMIPGIRTPEHVTLNTQGLFQLDDADKKILNHWGKMKF
jgi:aryl-alcohol dehydrogenase-like predicted oxidoreductase